jgi:NADPH:quinone reductase-like Zn-dependent oxidoreductase
MVLHSETSFRSTWANLSLTILCALVVAADPVGGEVFDKSTKAIAWGGRTLHYTYLRAPAVVTSRLPVVVVVCDGAGLLVVGFAGGKIPSVQTNRVLLKNCSIVGY